MKRFGATAFLLLFVTTAVVVGVFSGIFRSDPVGSSNEPYLIESESSQNSGDSRSNPVGSLNQPYSIEKFVSGSRDEDARRNDVLSNIANLNAELAAIEEIASKKGILPESHIIEAAFAGMNRELDRLKSRSLSESDRAELRESLRKSANPVLSRISAALNSRDQDHLVALAGVELARAMESLEGF